MAAKLLAKTSFVGGPPGCRKLFSSSRLLRSDTMAELSAPNGLRWKQPLGLFVDNELVQGQHEDQITSINP